MKKTILLSAFISQLLFSEVDIVESIPLTEHDLEVLSQSSTSINASIANENRADVVNPTIDEAQEAVPETDVIDDNNPPQKENWVQGISSVGSTVAIKSFLKGMLSGLEYNSQSVNNLKSKRLLKRFYAHRDYDTFWISTDYSLNPNIFQLLSLIKDIDNEGLDREKYHYDKLQSILDLIKNSQDLDENDRNINIAKFDIYLSDAFLTLACDLYEGEIDMVRFKELLRKKAQMSEIHYSWDLPNKSMDYVALLNSSKDSTDLQARLLSLSNSNNMLNSLKRAYKRYSDIAMSGGWSLIPRGRVLRVGSVDKRRVPLLANRLYLTGDFDIPDYNSSKMSKELSNALKHFQDRMGIWDSGKLNERTRRALNVSVEERLKTIALNISRLRNETQNFGDEYIIVNIPDFRMSFVKDGGDVLSMRVVVGRKKNPTPVFSSSMKYFELNPYWTVPDSIVKKEMLHRIQEDPDYLSSRGFKMYRTWKKGQKPADPFDVDWWKYDDYSSIPYHFVKQPGKGNPLGFVKFMFPNSHAVYMHDTDEKRFFKSSVRAYSHGCIRLQRPQELLEYITQNYTSESLDQIESLKKSKKNHSIRLNRTIPVHIRYFTAWVNEDGGVSFRKDIYGYDKMQLALMNRE